MSFKPPREWSRESDILYIHSSGVRIAKMTYKSKEGWVLMPVDLDEAVIEFEPTPAGRDQAFEAFANGVLKPKPKPKSKSKETAVKKAAKAKKAAKGADGETEEGEEKDSDEDSEDEDSAEDEP